PPHQKHIERLEQVRPHRLVEIEQFFATYKALEDKAVEIIGWRDHEAALQVLRDDREAWLGGGGGPGAGPLPPRPPPGRAGTDTSAASTARRLFVGVPVPAEAAVEITRIVDSVRAMP